jgi:hypothetical protein
MRTALGVVWRLGVSTDQAPRGRIGSAACLGIRFCVGCALIIPMIIQSIPLDPSGAVQIDDASNVSRPDPSGADQIDP